MKRSLFLGLFALVLCAACSMRPVSDAQTLASKIVREPVSQLDCGTRSIRFCEVHIDGQKDCACVDHRDLSRAR